MAAYILRNIPPDLWALVKLRAERERLPLRQVILLLLRGYGNGTLSISGHRSPR